MVYVELDGKGRLVLPKSVRKTVSASRFDVELDDAHRVVLTPILAPRQLFGAFPTKDAKVNHAHDLEKTHVS